jgi:hypothetical protein
VFFSTASSVFFFLVFVQYKSKQIKAFKATNPVQHHCCDAIIDDVKTVSRFARFVNMIKLNQNKLLSLSTMNKHLICVPSGNSITGVLSVYKDMGSVTLFFFTVKHLIIILTFSAVDSGWGSWGTWASCSQTCGIGTRTRTCVCDNPAPENGGLPCQEINNAQSMMCNV